jgi:hypothetical protein
VALFEEVVRYNVEDSDDESENSDDEVEGEERDGEEGMVTMRWSIPQSIRILTQSGMQ